VVVVSSPAPNRRLLELVFEQASSSAFSSCSNKKFSFFFVTETDKRKALSSKARTMEI